MEDKSANIKKKIWNIKISLKDSIKYFEQLVKEIDTKTFFIKRENRRYKIFEKRENQKELEVDLWDNENFSDIKIQDMLSVWITLGLVTIDNELNKTYDKSDFLNLQYLIEVKDDDDNLRKNIISNFHKKKYPELNEYTLHKHLAEKNEKTLAFKELYNGEFITYYNIFLGSLFEHKKIKNDELGNYKISNRNKEIINNFWTKSEISFDYKWFELALEFCFNKRMSINCKNRNDYSHENSSNLDLIIPDDKEESSLDESNIVVEIHNLGTFMKWMEDENNKYVQIPIYQRKYGWNDEIFLNLMDDIINESDKNSNYKTNFLSEKKYHYLGEISFLYNETPESKKTDNFRRASKQKKQIEIKNEVVNLIDGQQRLTSLLIIWRILFSYGWKKFIIDKFSYDHFNIKKEDKENKIIKKFQYIESNNDSTIFHKIMLGDNNNLKNEDKNTNMYKNFIAGSLKIYELQLNEEQFHNTLNSLLNKIVFTVINHKKNDEFDLFENLNSNKLSLKNVDLIKNYILMKVDRKLINDISKSKEILELFEKNISKNFENIENKILDEFLKIYCKIWQLENNKGKINKNINDKKQFYAIFKKIINSKLDFPEQEGSDSSNKKIFMSYETYKEFIEEINWNIKIFLEIIQLSKDNDQKNKNLFSSIVDILNSLDKREVYYAILMFLIKPYIDKELKKEDINDLRKKLFALETYEMTFKVLDNSAISFSQIMDGVLEDIKKIYDKNNQKISYEEIMDIFYELKQSISFKKYDMDEFEKKIEEKPIKDKLMVQLCKRVEFFLANGCKLEWNDMDEGIGKIKDASWEHIMPKTINDDDDGKQWKIDLNSYKYGAYFEKEHEKHLDLIGNAMAINVKKNSQVGNKKFLKKQQYYKDTDVVLGLRQYKGMAPKEVKIGNDNIKLELLSIENKEKWTFEDIKKRSKQLAKILKTVYTYYNYEYKKSR